MPVTAAAPAPPPSAGPALLTAEQYMLLPDDGRHTELVNGVVVEVCRPNFRHGVICNRIGRLLGDFVDDHDRGWVTSNDSGVVTRRNPDSVRGPDVAYFSFARVPRDAAPSGYPAVAPDLAVEVRSPSDRTGEVDEKIAEYLAAGVRAVVVADPDARTLTVHRPGVAPQLLTAADEFAVPDVLPGFAAPVGPVFR